MHDSAPGAFPEATQTQSDSAASGHNATESTGTANQRPNRRYPPRMCRICLETVFPTSESESQYLPSMLRTRPRVVYVSSDPELGRLLRPCKCKGSSRYVHEGCLQAWRHADPSFGDRNFWQCPTCGFKYKFQRVIWARWITSAVSQLALTFSILLFTVFLLGFIADPIINLYLDPVDTIIGSEFWEETHVLDSPVIGERTSWFEHFLKGLASLGVLSVIKAFLALSPWRWWHLRGSGFISSGGRNTGRTRVASFNWLVILFGVITFLVVSVVSPMQCQTLFFPVIIHAQFLQAVYKGVRQLVRRVLQRAGERVLDVQGPDDDEDEDDVDIGVDGSEDLKKEY